MREHKVKIWDKNKKRWLKQHEFVLAMFDDNLTVYKASCEQQGGTEEYESAVDFEDDITEQVEIVEYTGLKDTHGNDIYGGDILHLPTYSDWLIIWYESGFYLQIINGLGSGDKYSLTQSACNTRKVIGNIYENKELLNG